jgi:transcriptional regulator
VYIPEFNRLEDRATSLAFNRAQWESLGPEYQARMLRHIVFEIAVTRVEAKFKLSQNRTRVEQENVIRALAGSPDSAASGLAALMRQQGLGQP